jgi:hypothetical protein
MLERGAGDSGGGLGVLDATPGNLGDSGVRRACGTRKQFTGIVLEDTRELFGDVLAAVITRWHGVVLPLKQHRWQPGIYHFQTLTQFS